MTDGRSTPAHPGTRFSTGERYSRQVLFSPIGAQGQQRLSESSITLVGVGATGAMLATLLARAGVGRLHLIDRDVVDASNLQRQVLYTESDAAQGMPKAEAARRHLLAANSSIEVTASVADLTPATIDELIGTPDLLLDGTDNFEARYLLNDWAVKHGTPWIYTAAIGSYAATMNILPRRSAAAESPTEAGDDRSSPAWASEPTGCLACVFDEAPRGAVETCDTGGILGAAVSLAASAAATEALKCLTLQPHAMLRSLRAWDLWTGEHSSVSNTRPDPECRVCGHRVFTHLAGTYKPQITLCGRNSVQIHEHRRLLDLPQLAARLAGLGQVRHNELMLRLQLPQHVLTVFPDGRTLVQGTTDKALARSLYARYIGT